MLKDINVSTNVNNHCGNMNNNSAVLPSIYVDEAQIAPLDLIIV